jgi:signal peptidase I
MFEDRSGAPAAAPPPAAAAPRRWWLAALLSLVVCGLGQVYNGQLRKGVLLYLLQWPLALLASRTMVSPVPFSLALSLLLLVLLLRLFAIGDAIVVAKRLPLPFRLHLYNRWYVYLAACVVVFPLSSWGLKRAIRSQAESFYIPSGAMEDTVIPGDHIYVKSWGSRGAPRHDEIVVFQSVENPRIVVVKRCVALPGEVVKIVDKKLYVDDKAVDDSAYAVHKDPTHYPASYASPLSARDNFGPLTVPAGEFFALGDNRDNSWDSRFHGPVPQSNIIAGGMVRVYWSVDAAGHWRFNRMGALVH